MTLLREAITWHQAGYTPLPVKVDGSKAPAVSSWKMYQTNRPDLAQVIELFNVDHDGLGLLCGNVSAGLEMLELEGRAVDEGYRIQLWKAFEDHAMLNLWQRIEDGYAEITPSGGLHYYYRVDGRPATNTKLARRPSTPEELAAHPDAKIQVLIETRGEGGFSVIAPSSGRTHESGLPWSVLTGRPATIPTITEDERDALYAIASTLDQMPAAEPPPAAVRGSLSALAGGLRPGDDYNNRATWDDLLVPHGWQRHKHYGGLLYGWRKPGKQHPGISATTGRNDADNLYVFSTSTEFEAERPYSKFSAYTLLEHGGDYSAAAKALRAAGYGAPPPAEPRPLTLVHSGPAAPTDGTAALQIEQQHSELPKKVDATLTDNGNAQLIVDRHGGRLRYAPSRGQWLTWNGHTWVWCEDDSQAVQAATETIHAIKATDTDVEKHKTRSLSRRGIESAAMLARRDARILVTADDLDANPWQLNTPSGLVDLRTGQTRPSTPEDLCTRVTGANYNPFATATRWQQFLADTFGDNPEVVTFVQRLAGYSACGVVLHHVLPFLHGSGGNGKSVFLDVLISVLGDYASTAPAGFLMAGKQDDNAVARLAGLRLVVCSEVNQSARFDEAKVKLLTGGDRITARFLYQRHFTFTPTAKLWLMGNHQPKVDSGGESFWRRLRMIPFTRQVPDEKRIEGLAQQLIAEESEGILAWIIAGSVEVHAKGLEEPTQVMAATKTYAEEEDTLARFISDRCHLGGGVHTQIATAALRGEYEKWCQQEGETPLNPQVFGRELRTRYGIEQKRSHGRRFYVGMSLLASEDEDERKW